MSTVTITPQLKVTMLKLLVAGHNLDFVAIATHVPADRVLEIVSAHGYPVAGIMQRALDVLIGNDNKIPVRPTASLRTGPAPSENRLAVPRLVQQPAAPPSPGARPVHTSTAQLLHQAGESEYARTRGLGTKISGLIADLEARLDDEQKAVEAKADKEAAAVAARIATLEAEIAKLKGRRVKTGRIPSTTGQIPSSRPHVKGDFPCTHAGCGRTFDTGQGLALHRRRTHEGFNPNAAGEVA
jgi:hypothetical protein